MNNLQCRYGREIAILIKQYYVTNNTALNTHVCAKCTSQSGNNHKIGLRSIHQQKRRQSKMMSYSWLITILMTI